MLQTKYSGLCTICDIPYTMYYILSTTFCIIYTIYYILCLYTLQWTIPNIPLIPITAVYSLYNGLYDMCYILSL